ncbi:MAG: hypothetical protein JWP00_3343 [Chloroflexi bacterium]|jgi:hypothetical protein|nr:hypothetical protein [Chloroflexota bacterium]
MNNKFSKNSGPRCAGCGATFQPRVMRDGSLSQTCGQTACVARLNRKKDFTNQRSMYARPI